MGRSESLARCKKHPNHKQSQGVCSSCLKEKLSKLSASKNTIKNYSSSPSSLYSSSSSSSSDYSSYYSSCSSSSCSSPRIRLNSNDRISFFARGTDGFFGNRMARSKSTAFFTRSSIGNTSVVTADRKKKGGFWSKLIRSSSRRTKEDLMHSRYVGVEA